MNVPGHTLARQVIAVLRARQYLVFYAIGLYALSFAMTTVSAWLYVHRPIGELLDNARSPLIDAAAGSSMSILAIFLVYLAITTWLRAGYIRSLAGDFHLRPRDAGQFLRLLGLTVILAILYALGGVALAWGDQGTTVRTFVSILTVTALMTTTLALLYADYVIVLEDAGALTAMARSVRVLMGAFAASVLVLLVVTLLGAPGSAMLADTAATSLARAMPILVLWTIVSGAVMFVADVALLVIYLDHRMSAEAETRGE
jgi:hypothetical protein